VTDEATTTKLAVTPAELALRNSMPKTTVHSHTIIPVGTTAVGRRQARDTNHPTTVPDRNGHVVDAMPVMSTPSWWLRRPTAQNTSTPRMSALSHAGPRRDDMQRDYRESLTPLLG